MFKIKASKYFKLILLICVIIISGGCSFGATVDSMLSPPSLNGEQEQIYRTLQNTVGKNILLQYPKTGDYLSSFIVYDIDGDKHDEAIVFYRKKGVSAAENDLRVNLLDQMDGKWMSVCDIPAEGAEIERVMISSLGEEGGIKIIVGYSVVDRSERAIVIYDYKNNQLEENFKTSYSLFDIHDIDNDEINELIILQSAEADENAQMLIYKPDSMGNYRRWNVELRSKFTDFSQILYGLLEDGTTAIYIDAIAGATTMQTDILHFTGDKLEYMIRQEDNSSNTTRSIGSLTIDIDKDGIPEIPVQDVFPGYDAAASDQIKLTRWMTISNNKLIEKYRGYYSQSDGYAFMLPKEWIGTVTVVLDQLNGDLVFCRYNGSLSESTTELMRIGIAEGTENCNNKLDEGYYLLYSRGKAYYFIKTEESTDSIYLNEGELLHCFMIS
ncbi:MAG: hypothetical protein IJZ64_06625 [Ruminococcus sp.]|nr:hypothetical protein [Ruminococcus sp.]